jgi:hypothetical protein
VQQSEAAATFAYLTGESDLHGFVPINGATAVHDLFVAEPDVVADALVKDSCRR